MAASTTVRVSPETRDRLARLGELRGLSTPALIEDLTLRAEEQELLDRANEHYADLRGDSEAWAEHVAEREAWEGTLGDGLREEG
jgi:predicted transcriptional regulator